ncbi:MAG: PspC domain-containing protein [Flavobacteriaceae bacterium]|nr:PspC domain-containing protein [Flavobacteriaceae bacterium]
MNKTININLGGLFFHIDEMAFQKLKRYLDTIRRSLSDDPKGRDEIISDIELRISELLSEKIKDPRQVVGEADIDEVIAIMGQPEDYVFEDETYADYTRPGSSYSTYNSKKLFRDGDDKFLGGVAAGIAHYFGIESIWVRLAWLVLAFGLGFGFLLYIILWILLPEAKTTAEKLQMEGEAVNISTIEKKIRDEFQDVSERAKRGFDEVSGKVKDSLEGASEKVKEGLKDAKTRVKQDQIKSGLQEFIDVIGKIIATLFSIVGKFVGIILIIVALSTLVGLTVGLFTAGTLDIFGFDWFWLEDANFINTVGLPVWGVSLAVLLLVGIPFLMLFFLGMFILSSRSKTPGRVTWYVLLGLWLITIIALIVFGAKQTANFAFEGYNIENQNINITQVDTLRINMVDNQDFANATYLHNWRNSYKRVLTDDNKNKLYSNDVRLDIRLSDTDSSFVKIRKEAEGINRIVAQENAKKIDYQFNLTDATLNFNGYFLTDFGTKFRDQVLDVSLYIPVGKIIYIDNSTRSFLRHVENTTDIYDGDMPAHYYKMTLKGLDCLDCYSD